MSDDWQNKFANAPETPKEIFDMFFGDMSEAEFFTEPPQQKRRREEAEMRDALAGYLSERGLLIVREGKVFGGYIDIAVLHERKAVAIIETKIVEPIKGIGQLFGYRSGIKGYPTMILALPLEHMVVTDLLLNACREADVELWGIEADGTPIRLLRSREPAYPEGLVVKQELNP